MSTLKITGVDLLKLEEQRVALSRIDRSILLNTNQIEALDGIQNMLDNWSDQRYHSSLGSKTNQEARSRQFNLFDWNVCKLCGTETNELSCPRCAGPVEKIEFTK